MSRDGSREQILLSLRYHICMHNLNKNPLIAITLCLVLGLSSVGLPVIVVACSMGTVVVTKSCIVTCDRHSHEGQIIARQPCRAAMFFFDRNTTAYLPAKSEAKPILLQALLLLPASSLATGSNVAGSVKPEPSPPFIQQDIPVFISSLLI